MSMRMEDRLVLRKEGREDTGFGDTTRGERRRLDEGRSNDQDRTRSKARTWQPTTISEQNEGEDRHLPILQNARAIWRTKLNSARPEISLVPCAVCSVFSFSWEKRSARLGSS